MTHNQIQLATIRVPYTLSDVDVPQRYENKNPPAICLVSK